MMLLSPHEKFYLYFVRLSFGLRYYYSDSLKAILLSFICIAWCNAILRRAYELYKSSVDVVDKVFVP